MTVSSKKVSIIIPNYNNRRLLNDLLDSLKLVQTDYELIIIDNASEDDSVEFIKNNYPNVNLIVNDENMGFAYAINQGIIKATSEFVFLLNNDTLIESNTLDYLTNTINQSSNIFAVSSKMIQYPNSQKIDDAGDEYTLLAWSKKRGYNHNITEYSEDTEVFSACAGAALYRKSVFNEIGLFDENFESYVEDMDISFRARGYGYKIMYSAHAIVYHYGSATTGSRYNEFKVKISARNNIYLIHKNMPLWMKIINFIFIFIGIIIKYIFFYHKGYAKYYMDGIKEGISTRNNLTKTKGKTKNYLKIEWLMIKNTFKYLF